MSVSFVSSGSASKTTSSAAFSNSFNIGTVSSNGALVIFLFVSSGTASSLAITWNGVSMFNVASTTVADTGQGVTFTLFGLINPASGTNSAAATWVTSGEALMGFWSFTGADQSANSTTFINGTTVSVSGNHTSQSGSVTTANGDATVFGWDGGQTTLTGTPTPDLVDTSLNATVGDNIALQHILSTTASDSYTGSQSVGDFLKGCGCHVKASAAADVLAAGSLRVMRRKSVGWTPLSDHRSRIYRPRPKFYLPRKTILRAA